MTDYDRAINYINYHCRNHQKECLEQFHKDIQWHKDNGVPYDVMDIAHRALYLYGH